MLRDKKSIAQFRVMWGKTVSGHMKGNQNIFDIYYNKEEEGRRGGRGDRKGGGSGRGR